MKKSIFLAIFVLFSILTISSYAVEVTLLGPKQYLRTKGSPTKYSDTFPGRIGQGTLYIKNGTEGGLNRSSSAIIKVNGFTIFGTNSFNQNIYSLEAPISVLENNTVSIELRSAPGSYLTIEIKQEIEAEAAAVIGTDGGTVEVDDTASPLYGIRLIVPAGTVKKPSIFFINLSPPPPIPLPEDVNQDGEAMSFTCSSQLTGLVMAEIPFPSQSEDELRLFFYYDENTNTLKNVYPLPSPSPLIMRVALEHFSVYIKGRAVITSSFIHTSFTIPRDCLNAENSGTCEFDSGVDWESGICSGMSLLAETYFKGDYGTLFNEGLFCRWQQAKAYSLACTVQGRFFLSSGTLLERMAGLVKITGATLLSLLTWDQGILLEGIKYELKHNRPVSITMAGVLTGGQLAALHTSLVIGWEKTARECSERLILYDVNYKNAEHQIKIESIGILGVFGKSLSYSSGNYDYNFFGAITPDGLNIEDLITTKPADAMFDCSDQADPISWWPGNGNASDVVGGNHGTLYNGTTYATGIFGQGFSFHDGIKGDGDSIYTPAQGLDNLQELTIEAWVKLNSLPNKIQRFVSLMHERAVLRHDGENSPGQLHFYMRLGASFDACTHLRVDGVLNTGYFHHVAGTYDGHYMRLYLDGIQVAYRTIAGPISVGCGPGVALSSFDEPLDGVLDEVKIYNRALSAAEIRRIYESGRGRS